MSISIPVLRNDQVEKLDAWLRSVLWDSEVPHDAISDQRKIEVHRLKARIPLANGDVKIVQGVREIFEIIDEPNPRSEGSREGKVVLVGRFFARRDFRQSLLATLGPDHA